MQDIAETNLNAAREGAKRFGVPDKEVHILTGAQPKNEIEDKFIEIYARVLSLSLLGRRSMVLCYASGHGIVDKE